MVEGVGIGNRRAMDTPPASPPTERCMFERRTACGGLSRRWFRISLAAGPRPEGRSRMDSGDVPVPGCLRSGAVAVRPVLTAHLSPFSVTARRSECRRPDSAPAGHANHQIQTLPSDTPGYRPHWVPSRCPLRSPPAEGVHCHGRARSRPLSASGCRVASTSKLERPPLSPFLFTAVRAAFSRQPLRHRIVKTRRSEMPVATRARPASV